MKGIAFITAAVLVSGVSAFAQEPQGTAVPPAAAPAPQPAPAPAAAPPASAPDLPQPAQGLTAARLERIYHIRQVEGNLTNAVRAGASSLAAQLQVDPSSLFVTSNARARGFELEGYGVFFDVDVPTIMPSVLWASQVIQQQMQDVYDLQEAINNPKTDPRMRRIAEMQLARLQRALGLKPSPAPAVNAANTMPVPPQGLAVAATTDAPPAALAPPAASTPPAAVAPLSDTRDPNEIYTEAIKAKLIDAMLSYGSALRIADNEWLTIAARATNQSLPGTLDDSSSIVLRIKGADLTAFLTGKITRDEAVKRVEIKES